MVRISEDSVNVIGDSLEACLYARHLASQPNIKQVDHYTTGEYGGFYCDDVKDDSYVAMFFTSSQMAKIREYIPNVESVKVSEYYLKAPVKKIKFSSQYDEHITYPICKASFELEMDYTENVLTTPNLEYFVDMYDRHRNITKLMKTIFSDSVYMQIVKKIGGNQWNINQSQMSVVGLYNYLNLKYLKNSEPVSYECPVNGVSAVCRELLNHPKINVIVDTRKNIKNTTKKQTDRVTYILEYYDYYMDFMFGGFDYVKSNTEIHAKSISNSKCFKVITPFDDKYYVYFGVDTTTYKCSNVSASVTSHDFGRMQLIPSQANYRKMLEYHKISKVSRNFKIICHY